MGILSSLTLLSFPGKCTINESQMPGDLDTDVELSGLEYLSTSGWENTDLNSGYWSNIGNGTYGFSAVITGTDLGITTICVTPAKQERVSDE